MKKGRQIFLVCLCFFILLVPQKAFADEAVTEATKGTGIYQEGGIWKYFENGAFCAKTGIAKRKTDGAWLYVKNGIFQKQTGLAKQIGTGRWLYVKRGIHKKTTGHTTVIGNDKKIVYYKNGKRIKTRKYFTGVYRGKCYIKNKKVKTFRKKHWIYFLNHASSRRALSVKNGSVSKKKWRSLQKALQRYLAVTDGCGLIAVNTKTGLTISYNADQPFDSMSTIKAPMIAALCKYKAPGIRNRTYEVYQTLQYSNNDTYASLVNRYGVGYLQVFAKEQGASMALSNDGYAIYSPKQLAKLWCGMKEYLETKKGNANFLKKNLLFHVRKGKVRDYYKRGWYYQCPTVTGTFHTGGAGKDWVYSVFSYHHIPAWQPEARHEALVTALYNALH